MEKILNTFVNVARALGQAVDSAVPFAVGDRTKISAVVAFLAPIVTKFVCSIRPDLCPSISALGSLAGFATPFFGLAGLVRKVL